MGLVAHGISRTGPVSGATVNVDRFTAVALDSQVSVVTTAFGYGASVLGVVAAQNSIANVSNVVLYAARANVSASTGSSGWATSAMGFASYSGATVAASTVTVYAFESTVRASVAGLGAGTAVLGIASSTAQAVVSVRNMRVSATRGNITVTCVGYGVAALGLAAANSAAVSAENMIVLVDRMVVAILTKGTGHGVSVIGIAAFMGDASATTDNFTVYASNSTISLRSELAASGGAVFGVVSYKQATATATNTFVFTLGVKVTVVRAGGGSALAVFGVASSDHATTNVSDSAFSAVRSNVTISYPAGEANAITALGVASYYEANASASNVAFMAREASAVSITCNGTGLALSILGVASANQARAAIRDGFAEVVNSTVSIRSGLNSGGVAALGAGAYYDNAATIVTHTTFYAASSWLTVSCPEGWALAALGVSDFSASSAISGATIAWCDGFVTTAPSATVVRLHTNADKSPCTAQTCKLQAYSEPCLPLADLGFDIPAVALVNYTTACPTRRTSSRTHSLVSQSVSRTGLTPTSTAVRREVTTSSSRLRHSSTVARRHTTPWFQITRSGTLTAMNPAARSSPSPSSSASASSTHTQQHSQPTVTLGHELIDVPPVVGHLPTTVVVTVMATTATIAVTAVAGLLVPSTASQPARLMATAAMARCAEGLSEPSYLEHPFQQHWLPFDGDAPAATADTRRAADSEAAVALAAASINSALTVAVLLIAALLLAVTRKIDRVLPHAAASAGTAAAYFAPNVAASVSGLAQRGWMLASVSFSSAVCVLALIVLAGALHRHANGHEMWRKFSEAFAGGTRADPGQDGTHEAGGLAHTAPWKRAVICRHFFVDVGTAVLIALLGGLRPENVGAATTTCRSIAAAACVLALLFLAYLAWLQPLADRWEQHCTVVSAAAQLLLTVLAIAVLSDRENDTLQSAFGYTAMAVALLFLIQALVLAVKELATWRNARRRKSQSADDGDTQLAAPLLTISVPTKVVAEDTTMCSPMVAEMHPETQLKPINPLKTST
jgi:hypothetical protein